MLSSKDKRKSSNLFLLFAFSSFLILLTIVASQNANIGMIINPALSISWLLIISIGTIAILPILFSMLRSTKKDRY
jgi:NAD/NADP transhydrogenase beta subunit